MAQYTKPFLTIDEQLKLLKSRGLVIADETRASRYLGHIGYYRLGWYLHSLREIVVGTDGKSKILETFRQGTDFDQALELYVFDKRLRLLMLDAIERIEISVRAQIAIRLGAMGAFSYLDTRNLNNKFIMQRQIRGRVSASDFDFWKIKQDQQTKRQTDKALVKFRNKYSGDDFPIWIAIELWDFGMLSRYLTGLSFGHQQAISSRFGIAKPELFTSWIRLLNFVRNVCAHHGRLWNRSMVDMPRKPKVGAIRPLDHAFDDEYRQSHVYVSLAILQFLLHTTSPNSSWSKRLVSVLSSFPAVPGLSIREMGLPDRWEELPLWQDKTSAEPN